MRKIFFTAVIFLLPTLLQAQENKLYGEQYIKAIADNTRLYVSKRPEVKDRLFRSEAVDKKIEEVKKLLKNNRYLAWMFENCFPNTLETTVHYRKTNGEDDTFVYTGDIPAMWLRDSGAQVFPYVRLASKDPKLKSMLRGVILRQLRQINIDPYANAFNITPTKPTCNPRYSSVNTKSTRSATPSVWPINIGWPRATAPFSVNCG